MLQAAISPFELLPAVHVTISTTKRAYTMMSRAYVHQRTKVLGSARGYEAGRIITCSFVCNRTYEQMSAQLLLEHMTFPTVCHAYFSLRAFCLNFVLCCNPYDHRSVSATLALLTTRSTHNDPRPLVLYCTCRLSSDKLKYASSLKEAKILI
jgi:hypothetical protein